MQVKTDAQKRYLKKKVAKRKILVAARKRSTPKSKSTQSGDVEDGEEEEVEEEAPVDQSASAMQVDEPSEDVSAAPEPEAEASEESKEARKIRRRLEKEAKKPVRVKDVDMNAPGEGIINENQKELLKKAKKAMSAAKKPTKSGPADADADDDQVPAVASSSRSRSGSPLVPEGTLPSFPLPVGPAKPDAALLSAQGLPSALKDAVLIDEGLRTRIDDLRIQRSRKGKEKEREDLDETLKKKLREAGVEEFFAGE